MCAELNICIAAQPAFLNWNLEPAHYLEKIIGKRTYDISPYRTILDMGIHVSGGSDAPCTTVDPINGMYCACNHYVKEESISIKEALKMFTYEAAYLGFDEKERGSLEVSKVADMVVLNKNPYELNREDLKELKVEEFYLSGSKYEKDVPLTSKLLSYLKGRGKKM
jgi:predicted amidohydrolase YtcJ